MNSMAPHTERPRTQFIEVTITGDVNSDEINDDGGTIFRYDNGKVELQYNSTKREILANPIIFKEHLKDIDDNLSKFSQKDNSSTYQVDKSSMEDNDTGDIFQFQTNTLNQVKASTTRIDGLIQGVQRTTVGIGADKECVGGMENNAVEGSKGKWKRLDPIQRIEVMMDVEGDSLKQKRKMDTEHVLDEQEAGKR